MFFVRRRYQPKNRCPILRKEFWSIHWVDVAIILALCGVLGYIWWHDEPKVFYPYTLTVDGPAPPLHYVPPEE